MLGAGSADFKQVENPNRQHEPSWKSPIHARQWAQTLEDFAYPVIGGKAPGDVTTADVIAILKPSGTPCRTASRVRGRIESILAAWKVESGRQDRFNPATWKGHLDAVFPRKSKVEAGG